ncbi:DMT family transporter [Mucilaginibacter agri]|uniref:EamA family transporter n=1 Tax=Mucilaginibacter agri TaxID=2695265 RepID=A0A965ZIX6_9SPHI|nr:DMT family transporter [Mucilaginibacter agri]NCD71973.1 EamA family transporter [Mucilaginibacter agri]
MIYIFLSVCCSVAVSIMLKLARRYSIDVFQAITWNYSIAIILTLIFLKPQLGSLSAAPVYNYTILGILLPSLFVVIAASVRFTGIVRTDTAQRLSLVIPLLAAFFLFNEQLTTYKLIGIAVGLVAIILLLMKPKTQRRNTFTTASWLYPIVVFLGFGVIDVMFRQLALVKDVSFATSLFAIYVIAFVLSIIGLIYMVATKKTKFLWRYIGFGWMLGVANFGNILFYLLAHKAMAKSPSVVFSAMNIGVIAVGTMAGTFLFKEKTSSLNRVGIILAITAVIIIAYAQTH